jgi:hypothetical protein
MRPAAAGRERIVLVTERRLGAHAPDWTPSPAVTTDAEFTVVELRVDARGVGEGKASLTTNVGLDAKGANGSRWMVTTQRRCCLR